MVKQKRENPPKKKLNLYTTKKPEPPFAVNAWVAKMRCIFRGLIRVFSTSFTSKFKKDLSVQTPAMMKKVHEVLTPIIHQDEEFANQIKQRLKSIGRPYYFELIYRYDLIYDHDLVEELKEALTWNRNVRRAQGVIIRLYKKLNTLHSYLSVLRNALKVTLLLEKDMKNLDIDVTRKNFFYLDQISKKLIRGLYPKLEYLMTYYYETAKDRHPKLTFEQFIKHQKSDVMGYYTQIWRENKEFEEKRARIEEQIRSERERKETEKDQQKNELFDRIRSGLQLIQSNVDFKKFHNALRKNRDPLGSLALNDKAFLILAMMEFFHRRYSGLYLNNSVEYATFKDQDGSPVDVVSQLKEAYYQMNTLYQRMREYMRISKQIENEKEIKEQTAVTLSNFKKLSNQRDDLFRIINYEVRKNIKTFSEIFETIVERSDGSQNILVHPEQTVNLGTQNANGTNPESKTVIEVIKETNSFLTAMEFLLTEGDLNSSGHNIQAPRYIRI